MVKYNIEIREFNGIDYDILYPKTIIENVEGLNNNLNQINKRINTISTKTTTNTNSISQLQTTTNQINTNIQQIDGNIDLLNQDMSNIRNTISDIENNKQNKLTFDNTPTANSSNPVTSNGIKESIDQKSYFITNNSTKIKTIAEDTVQNWANRFNCVYYYTLEDNLINKPSSYGILINNCSGTEISQLWFTQSTGKIYRRSGNSSGWQSSWVEVFSGASIIPTANGGTGNANGTVAKLTTPRTIQTNLASTSAASFDGSANITPGVTGTLPIANGGTGGTDSGWLTMSTSSSYTGTIYYRKIGTFCEVVSSGALKLTEALTDTSGTLLNTLPSGYRPSREFYFPTSSTYSSAVLQIGTNGNMRFYKERSLETWDTGRTFYIHMFFFCVQ